MGNDGNVPEGLDIEALAAHAKKHLVMNYTEDQFGCWIHNNAVNSEGYVTIVVGNPQKAYKAHRLSYIIFKGEIPEDGLVCHTCDVRNCINPEHLYVGTPSDNTKDMYSRGRSSRALSEDDIGFIIVLHESGYSQGKIAEMLGVAQTSVSKHLRSIR